MSGLMPPAQLADVQAASNGLYQGGADEKALIEPLEGLLLHAITHQPRSLQRMIGPSEIGTPCDHCLAAKLARWEQTEVGIPWAATVGTAIHALIEQFIADAYLTHLTTQPENTPFRYWAEQKVMVGQIGGRDVWGSTDLVDVTTGSTVDWKAVADSSLANYKTKGPSPTYRVQAHLYAKGWNDAGIPIERVSICFLSRASNNFYKRHWWTEAYNPQIAGDALARANQIHANLTALASISKEVRDSYITGLPRAPGCWDCKRFPDAPTPPNFNLPISTN